MCKIIILYGDSIRIYGYVHTRPLCILIILMTTLILVLVTLHKHAPTVLYMTQGPHMFESELCFYKNQQVLFGFIYVVYTILTRDTTTLINQMGNKFKSIDRPLVIFKNEN